MTNTAIRLQLAHGPNGELSFMPRVGKGAVNMGVCPTRQLVLETPKAVRSEVWGFPNGCQSVFNAAVCRDRLGDKECNLRTVGCRLEDCGGDVPCCVHPMPSEGAVDAAAKARFELYQQHVGR